MEFANKFVKNSWIKLKDNPEISVILPFYNASETLDAAINSIVHQSFKNFECLLVDNNSNDTGSIIVKNWCEKDKRFRLLAEHSQGVM